jgi:hypothetical protein
LHLLETRSHFLHNIFTNSAFLFNIFKVLLVDKGKKTGCTKLLKFLEVACASEDYGVEKIWLMYEYVCTYWYEHNKNLSYEIVCDWIG